MCRIVCLHLAPDTYTTPYLHNQTVHLSPKYTEEVSFKQLGPLAGKGKGNSAADMGTTQRKCMRVCVFSCLYLPAMDLLLSKVGPLLSG